MSTYGLMKDASRKSLTNMVYQLVDQGLLARSDGEWPTLELNEASWEVMRGQREVRLVQAPPTDSGKVARKTAIEKASWAGVD